jgi:ribonuclease HII
MQDASQEASFAFPGRISAEREAPDAAIFDEGIASAISEEKGVADGRLSLGRKLPGKVNGASQERQRLESMMAWERNARKRGFYHIAGVDEAGRGPLAGPVVAAACILPESALIEGIDDSKKLPPSERFRIFQQIVSTADVEYGVGIVDALIIDQVNILQATFQAMIIAISRLNRQPDYLLIDGNRMPATPIPGHAIIKGDSLSQSIAAASIIAKETRDQIMRAFHEQWPQYHFSAHKGYATQEHLLAIQKYGPCPIHRMSFDPLKSIFQV